MRIALYGLPCAGKSFILEKIRGLDALTGSGLLHSIAPCFSSLSEEKKTAVRKELATTLSQKDGFIMDGHYAFGSNIVFTPEDGSLYDAFLYLRIDPVILKERMNSSEKNRRYADEDIASWQALEIQELRNFCHSAGKDFYVLDNPTQGCFEDVSVILEFIDEIIHGFSCVSFAHQCADSIIAETLEGRVTLVDGDGTLTIEDTSKMALNYRTNIFDGNFYTGFQSWLHYKDLRNAIAAIDAGILSEYVPTFNKTVLPLLTPSSFILTSGAETIWERISRELRLSAYHGPQMSADTKFHITKTLRSKGIYVRAIGDSMNDFYMLMQADEGYLVHKSNGNTSRSLDSVSLKGFNHVYPA